MVEELGYYAFDSYSKTNLMADLIAMLNLGVCPPYHSPNDVILLFTTSNVHDQETLIIG
jgi:hypothetical protein